MYVATGSAANTGSGIEAEAVAARVVVVDERGYEMRREDEMGSKLVQTE